MATKVFKAIKKGLKKGEKRREETVIEIKEEVLKEVKEEIRKQNQRVEQRREREKTDSDCQLLTLEREVQKQKREVTSYKEHTDSLLQEHSRKLQEHDRRLRQVEESLSMKREELQQLDQHLTVLDQRMQECEKTNNFEAAATIKEEKKRLDQYYAQKLDELFEEADKRDTITMDVSEYERWRSFEKMTNEKLQEHNDSLARQQEEINNLEIQSGQQQECIANHIDEMEQYRSNQTRKTFKMFSEIEDLKKPRTLGMPRTRSMNFPLHNSPAPGYVPHEDLYRFKGYSDHYTQPSSDGSSLYKVEENESSRNQNLTPSLANSNN